MDYETCIYHSYGIGDFFFWDHKIPLHMYGVFFRDGFAIALVFALGF